VPLGDDTSVFDALIMGSRAVVMSVVNAETPPTVFPQGAVPFVMIGLVVAAFKAIGERGTFMLVSLVFRDGACFQTIFSFNIAPLVFGWPLSGENAG